MRSALQITISLLLIVGIGLVIYLPAFQASFHLDDGPSIQRNSALRGLEPGPVFRFWPTRFAAYYSLALTYRVGRLEPFAYHLGNVFIHLVTSLAVFFLLRRLLGREHPVPVLFGALFFLAHPVQTQAVTYVVQRATSLAAGFYLLSLLFYLKSRDGSGRGGWYPLALVCAAGALFSKEFAVTLPFALLLAEFTVLKDRPPGKGGRVGRLVPFFLLALVVPVLFLLHRDNLYYNDPAGIARGSYLFTQSRVFITYLRLIVLPLHQQVEYDYPRISSFFAPGLAVYLSAWFALVIAAIFCSRRKSLQPAGFGIAFFLLALLPESSLVPIGDVMVEHRLYLPLFGAALGFAFLLRALNRFPRSRFILAAGLVFALGRFAYTRNLVWETPITLWEDNVSRAPRRARIRGNLGKAYLDRGRFERAAEEFREMIELDPSAVGAYNNLAVIYIDHLQDYRLAEKYIEASLALFPDYPAGYLNRGVIHLNNRRLKPAIREFEKALELDRGNLLAHYNLGACYINLGDMHAREAASLRTSRREEEAREKEETARGEYARAEEYLRRGLGFWPEEGKFYLLLARLYRSRGEEERAEKYFGEWGLGIRE